MPKLHWDFTATDSGGRTEDYCRLQAIDHEKTGIVCNICRRIDFASILKYGIIKNQNLVEEEDRDPCHKFTVSPPEITMPFAEPREDDSVSEEDLSGEDDSFSETEATSPTVDLGFAHDIDEKQHCPCCRLIMRLFSVSYTRSEPFELESVDVEQSPQIKLALFRVDELPDFRDQYGGPTAWYIDVQLRMESGSRAPRRRYLLQDASNAQLCPAGVVQIDEGPAKPFYSGREMPAEEIGHREDGQCKRTYYLRNA